MEFVQRKPWQMVDLFLSLLGLQIIVMFMFMCIHISLLNKDMGSTYKENMVLYCVHYKINMPHAQQ